MKVLVIFWHFKEASFTHQIYKHTITHLTKKGHEVKARNLHKLQFNPVLSSEDLAANATKSPVAADIAKEQEYVKWADALIFIYPIWWWERPAMIKGWCDRVLTRGFAFDYGPNGVSGLLKGKKGLSIQLVGMPQSYPIATEKSYIFQNSMIDGTLGFCGIEDADALTLYDILHMKSHDAILKTGQVSNFLDYHF